MLWMMFTDPANRARMVHWESAARAVLSQFRAAAGRHPGDPRFTELVEALSEVSPRFRDWWAEHPVRYFRPAVIAVRHPEAGLIQLEMFQLRLVDQPGLIMVVQVPAGESYLARVRSLLSLTLLNEAERHQGGGLMNHGTLAPARRQPPLVLTNHPAAMS
jgi:hypothetical protein